METPQNGQTGGRHARTLDGPWQFQHASDGVWRTAAVPMPWQAEFADLRHESGRALYRKTVELPADWAGLTMVLMFGAVSYLAEVSVNGHVAGSHEGGYLPFECELPADILSASNTVEVSVLLPDGNAAASPEFPFAEIPHGKQSWYGPIGGIWQPVRLEARQRRHLLNARIEAVLATGVIKLTLQLSHQSVGAPLTITVLDPAGSAVATATSTIVAAGESHSLSVSNARPWSPTAPNLYSLRIDIGEPDSMDSTTHTFGFRHFETRGGRFYLNGEPFYLRGALDQDYYPETICTPPSTAFIEDQFRKARELGLNMLRCHIKVPDPRYYEVADRTGMLIWTEIPNVATFTAQSAERLRDTMLGILKRDFNHPSIVIWTIINEDWGTRTVEDASHRRWLKETYDWLKALDPTRLVVDNSACHNNFHVKSDINDYHYYRSVPERRAEWDKLTEEFAGAAGWTFSAHGDAERRGDEPLVVSEFGVWGLPDPAKVVDSKGQEPWWMETGAGWGDGAAYPHGVQNRFAAYRLGAVFGSFENFIAAAQWYQFANLKYEIETLRLRSQIQGYVITEMTDVHWESNGLLDMNRNRRVFHDRFASINADLVIVPKIARYSGASGDQFQFSVAVATGGVSIPAGAILHWALNGGASGAIEVPPAGSLSTTDLGEVTTTLPEAPANRMAELEFRLSHNGQTLSRNNVEIALYARRAIANLPTVAAADDVIAAFARGLGYQVAAPGAADIQVVRALGKADIAALQAGARYLVLADGSARTHGNLRLDAPAREQPFMPIVDGIAGNLPGPKSQLPNITLTARHGTMWRGDWIASFSWIRRDGPFASLPGGPLLDLSFDRVVPNHVLGGFEPWEYGGPVQAGLVVGWVHKAAATIATRRVGSGGLTATTFRLLSDPPGSDSVASALFDALTAQTRVMVTGGPA